MTWKQRKVVQIQGHYGVWPVYTWVMNQCLVSLCKKGDTHTHTHAIKSFWNRLECLPKQRVKWSKKRDGSVWCGLLSQRWFLPHLEFPRKNSSVFWAGSAARTALFSTLCSRNERGRRANVTGCTGWGYRNHHPFLRVFCRMSFAWRCSCVTWKGARWGTQGPSRHLKDPETCRVWQQLGCNRVCWGAKVLPMVLKRRVGGSILSQLKVLISQIRTPAIILSQKQLTSA